MLKAHTFITTCIFLATLAPANPTFARPESTTLVYPPFKHNYGLNKVRQFHVSAYAGFGKKVSSPQGVAAVKLKFTDKPGTGDDEELTVFGVNSGRGEIVYNPSLRQVRFEKFDKHHLGAMRGPHGIAATSDGLVIVADTGNHRLVVMRVDSTVTLRPVDAIDLRSTGTPLLGPRDVAIEQERVYVADYGNDRVVTMSPAGVVEGSVSVLRPRAIAAIHEFTHNYFNEQFIVVGADDGRELWQLRVDGTLRKSIDYREIAGSEGSFGYLAIDYYGSVYATDGDEGCVFKFDRHLNLLDRFECRNDRDDRLDSPRGIAIYRRFGQVFVAEETGGSYFWIGTDIEGLTGRRQIAGRGIRIDLSFVLTEYSSLQVELEFPDADKRHVLDTRNFIVPGRIRLSYLVTPEQLPCDIADCTVDVVVSARATYSSKNYHEAIQRVRLR